MGPGMGPQFQIRIVHLDMKRFLKLYFNFEDDLRRAAAKAEEAGNGGSAGTLLYYADQLRDYKPEKRYLCDCSHRLAVSSLKMWQRRTFEIAKRYDRCIFTRQEMEDLAARLREFAKTQKFATEEVRDPNFEDEEKYGIRPSIQIGHGCAVSFTPIKGDYEYE